MAIRTESGSTSAAIGLIGAGLIVIFPDQKWIGWALVAGGFLVFLFDIRIDSWRIRARGRRLHTWGPWLLIIGCPVAGAIWLYFASQGGAKLSEAPTKSQLDGTVKLECLHDFFQFPADGKFLELISHDENSRFVTLQSAWMSEYASKENPKSIPTKYGMIDKCRLTNFGTAPIFNVKFGGYAQFSEHIPRGDNTVEQRIVDSKEFEFLIPQIDPGSAKFVELYAWNTTKFIVSLRFKDRAELQKLASTERESVQLIPALNFVTLWPPES
jgi:hypothetical protein